MKTKIRFGFKSRKQTPLFMIWKEYWESGEVIFAAVIINSVDWIGI